MSKDHRINIRVDRVTACGGPAKLYADKNTFRDLVRRCQEVIEAGSQYKEPFN